MILLNYRQYRLQDMQQRASGRRQQETQDETQARLQRAAQNAQERRNTAHIRCNAQPSTRYQYLHEKGWANSQTGLHEQPWVKGTMSKFHERQSKWEHQLCNVCHEVWPTQTCLKDDTSTYTCTRCKRDKGNPKRYSSENDMDPGVVPECLQKLSQVEEMLIARTCPIMCIYCKHGGQRGYKGHVINFPQDIQGFLNKLPCSVNDLPILVVRRHGADNTHKDFKVRRDCVLYSCTSVVKGK